MSAEPVRRGTGRARIIEAATELFLSQGYAGTTTRDIAARAGIRQPSLYAHFKVKADILLEVLAQPIRASVETSAALIEDAGLSAVERLARLVEFDVKLLCDGPNLAHLGYLPDVRAEQIDAELDAQHRDLRRAYQVLVEGALNEAGRPVEDARGISDVVLTLVEGVILRRIVDPSVTGEQLAPLLRDAVLTLVR
ncbi:TetR/AcrR family transcriptional regulator [Nocardioides houyundeii]|uniref:TetR/AcrR family transcriptional regulator n=1 Tax=Nocardioides houyundeii TaxID=2045452 RepID=UPI001315933E|nr:TetR/AcrR family transcriptional regulator [Nocardioides houyundeii]